MISNLIKYEYILHVLSAELHFSVLLIDYRFVFISSLSLFDTLLWHIFTKPIPCSTDIVFTVNFIGKIALIYRKIYDFAFLHQSI